MRHSGFIASRLTFAVLGLFAALILFVGTATPATASPALPGSNSAAPGGSCTPTPALWASDADFFGSVTGYGGPNLVPLCVIGLPASGLPFLVGPLGLATDATGTLYVSDSGNDRIVEYTKNGALITSFTTNLGSTLRVPVAVCVSPKSRIGVVTNQNAGNSNVEVFDQSGSLVGSATTANLAVGNYCAFDRAENLFIDGQNPSGNSFIWYLPQQQLNTLGGTLTLTNAGSGGWLGMFSRNTSGWTISAATIPYSGPGCSYCFSVKTWTISGGSTLSLTLLSTCTITNHPNSATESVRQVAPSTSGDLYIADWLDHKIERTAPCPSASQPASTLNPVTIPPPVGINHANPFVGLGGPPVFTFPSQLYWGVATYPTGQY